jgi:hypothetical protein
VTDESDAGQAGVRRDARVRSAQERVVTSSAQFGVARDTSGRRDMPVAWPTQGRVAVALSAPLVATCGEDDASELNAVVRVAQGTPAFALARVRGPIASGTVRRPALRSREVPVPKP